MVRRSRIVVTARRVRTGPTPGELATLAAMSQLALPLADEVTLQAPPVNERRRPSNWPDSWPWPPAGPRLRDV